MITSRDHLGGGPGAHGLVYSPQSPIAPIAAAR